MLVEDVDVNVVCLPVPCLSTSHFRSLLPLDALQCSNDATVNGRAPITY
jgi:hypothetical protein